MSRTALPAADDGGGLCEPRGTLVDLGAGCVLGLAGLVPCLLREGDGLAFGRRATVLGLEGGREFAAAGLDGAVSLGPGRGQTLVDADDLAHRPLVDALVQAAAAVLETNPQPCDELGLDEGVVHLREGDVGLEQDPSVDGEPASGLVLDLVADRDVGVQVRVGRACVAVGEHARDKALGLDLLEAAAAAAREKHLLLQPRQRGLDSRVVGVLDFLGDVAVGQCPQCRDGLHRSKGEVVPGHRGGLLSGGLGHEGAALAVVDRGPTVLAQEVLVAQFGADPRSFLGRDRRPPVRTAGQVVGDVALRGLLDELRLVPPVPGEDTTELGGLLGLVNALPGVQGGVLQPLSVWVTALAEQVPHVGLGDLRAHLEVERAKAGAEPTPRRLALLGVVVGQPRVATVGGIVHGDLAGQVRVPVSRGQLVHTHHVTEKQQRRAGFGHLPGTDFRQCMGCEGLVRFRVWCVE